MIAVVFVFVFVVGLHVAPPDLMETRFAGRQALELRNHRQTQWTRGREMTFSEMQNFEATQKRPAETRIVTRYLLHTVCNSDIF